MTFDANDKTVYYNKVLGGWVGKCAGGILGAPIEGYKTFNDIQLTDELFANNFANDDLDLQVLWLDMMAKKGPNVRHADFANHWLNHVAFPWNEYGIATRNLTLGLDPPDSGSHNNWYWRESMGSPIRSEIWGMLFPGDPARAARFARMDSELDHTGFSVEAEMFFSACAAIAFSEDDLERVIDKATAYVESDGDCAHMVCLVTGWYADYGFDVAAGKIKSYYGDADFTSAPMNVAFTVLAMLHAGRDFDLVVKALHLGHDSDCVVATAGAILGIVTGYDAIPATWKRRVGNELLISPEVSGIDCPDTLTGLAEKTLRVAAELAESQIPGPAYALHCTVETFPDPSVGLSLGLCVHLENLTAGPLEIRVSLTSDHFGEDARTLTLPAGQYTEFATNLPLTADLTKLTGPKIPYTVTVVCNRETKTFAKGIPYYGEWLLVGPFLRADDARIPMDPVYPDHGLASMPSVSYMNHDADNRNHDFLTHDTITELLDGHNRAGCPYHVATVRPSAMTTDLGAYFRGRGERTLYLTTRIHAPAAIQKWLNLGAAGYLTVWLNGQRIMTTETPLRRWPGAHAAELDLRAGANTLTIRLDALTDDFNLDVGLKNHLGRHPHQSQWDTELCFSVPVFAPAAAPV